MKILKLLNRKNLSIFIISFLLFLNHLNAQEEPVDIWNLEKKVKENSTITQTKNDDAEEISINVGMSNLNNSSDIIDSDLLGQNKINIVGLYDPEDNGLSSKKDKTETTNARKINNTAVRFLLKNLFFRYKK